MKLLRGIFNGKAALQAVDLSDILISISDDERKKLQKIILDIYKDILGVCQQNGWTPYLVGGSALGAIRHNGFIPWDDDLDVGMLRNEYDLFLAAFDEIYHDKYLIMSPGNRNGVKTRFAKILKRGTLLKEFLSTQDDEKNGIFVDIFPIDNVPDSDIQKNIKGILSDILAYISSQVYTYVNRNQDIVEALKRTGYVNYTVRMLVGKVFSIKSPEWWFEKYDRCVQYSKKTTRFCTIAAGRKHYFGEMIERNKIVPAKFVTFCDIEAPVFNNVNSYLSHMYGDYMKIPPQDKRERHYVKEIRF